MDSDDLRTRLRAARSRVRVPPEAATIVVLATLYAALGLSAIAVAAGATLFVWSRVGPYAALAVGGTITFAVSYVTLRVADALRGGTNE